MSSRAPRFRSWHIVAVILAAASSGFTVFVVLAWRSITVERARPEDALRKFEQVRSQFAGMQPILHMDANGGPLRQSASPNPPPPPPNPTLGRRLQVGRPSSAASGRADLVPEDQGTGDAVRVPGHRFDLERPGITPAELERHGAVLVLDEASRNGDRLLVLD